MIVVVAAIVIGFWVAGPVGAAIGGCIVLALAISTYLSTPKENRETLHQARMRTDQAYRDAHMDLGSGRKAVDGL